jgi:hypothetical protein
METAYQRIVAPHVPTLRVTRVSGTSSSRQSSPSKIVVLYHDGAHLTYLFDRTTLIADLAAMISRAGRVRKVVL